MSHMYVRHIAFLFRRYILQLNSKLASWLRMKVRLAFHAQQKSLIFLLNQIALHYQLSSHHTEISPYHLQNEIKVI